MVIASEQEKSLKGKPSFEVAFEQLQLSVKKLESGELTLDDALRQFEDGVKLTRICQEYLTVAEQRVEVLMKSGTTGEVELQPFASSSRHSGM